MKKASASTTVTKSLLRIVGFLPLTRVLLARVLLARAFVVSAHNDVMKRGKVPSLRENGIGTRAHTIPFRYKECQDHRSGKGRCRRWISRPFSSYLNGIGRTAAVTPLPGSHAPIVLLRWSLVL